MFATLVPGFPSPKSGFGIPSSPLPSTKVSPTASVFHDSAPGNYSTIFEFSSNLKKKKTVWLKILYVGPLGDFQPVLPPQSGEKPLDEPMRYFLDVLLDAMVSQVSYYSLIRTI